CKGGVGKTTVAAHLAGACALRDWNTILIDLDPDCNLKKLFSQGPDDASMFVPPSQHLKRRQEGAVITVLNRDEWDEAAFEEDIVICDCSPVMSENPAELIKKFDYCIIPTTLNPLGINKNGDVITRTLRHIRSL